MISLNSIEQAFAGCVNPAECDPRVSLVLDYATWHSEDNKWELRKPLGPHKAGDTITLEQLHALLFPKGLTQ